MAYEALYRRYRPSRFQDAFFGQDHVVAALRNAIDGDRVGHAYLFSGPRGTGKTTSARILAKALNCTNLQGGEPCNECDSCLAFQTGGSYDLHELDAASNNGVEAMRDLIGKVALGSPGRTKVYILDEVHMLSSGAENALLKTLEEPPPHVVFVLCTTEPNKVVPTIRSRTQHLEFSLLSAAQVGELVDHVTSDAGIEITPEDRQYVIRAGGGSARDTLSALDQVVAAGGAPQGGEHLEALFQALIDRNAPAALAAIDGAMQAGRDPGQVGASLLHELRTVFLAAMRADLGHLPEAERDRATTRAADMPPARVTRAIEVIGTSLIEMRQAPDPRIDLEVAIMRLTRADLDTDAAALVERLEGIERQLAGGAPVVAAPQAAPPQQAPTQAAPTQNVPAQADPAPVSEVHGGRAPATPTTAAQPTAPAQREPQYTEQPPAQATPPQSAPAQPAPQAQAAPSQQSGGRRGADLVRAELERQGIAPAKPPTAAAPEPITAQPADGGAAAPSSSGKTLADVRRERQAAAQVSDDGADGAEVEANAAARRERQAAAQAHGAASEPSPPATEAQAAPPQPAPAPAQATPAQATPAQADPAPAQAAPPQPAPQAVPPQPASEAASVQEAAAVPAEQAPEPQAASTEQSQPEPVAAPVQEAAPSPQQAQPAAGAGVLPTLDELNAVWPTLLAGVSNRVKSRFAAGHFVETTADAVQFGLPNPVHRDRCEEIREEVDQVLATQFGRPIPLALVVDLVEDEPDFFAAPPSGGAGAVVEDMVHEEDTVDVHSLVDATDDVPSAEDRVMNTFENSVLLEDPANQQPHH